MIGANALHAVNSLFAPSDPKALKPYQAVKEKTVLPEASLKDRFSLENGAPTVKAPKKKMERQLLRSLPQIGFNAALMIGGGFAFKALGAATIIGLPVLLPLGIYLDVAGAAHFFRSVIEDWKNPYIPAQKTKQGALTAITNRGYALPKLNYNLALLNHVEQQQSVESHSPLGLGLQVRRKNYEKAKALIEKHIDPKRPTHLSITRKQLTAAMGASPRTAEQKSLLRYMFPLDMVRDKFMGGGKASIDDVALALQNLEVKQQIKTPELAICFKVLDETLSSQYQRALIDDIGQEEPARFIN